MIVAERIRGGRYWTLLETLAEKLDLVALEVRCMRVAGSVVVWLEPVLLPEDLESNGKGQVAPKAAALSEADWRAKTTADFQGFVAELRARLSSRLDERFLIPRSPRDSSDASTSR